MLEHGVGARCRVVERTGGGPPWEKRRHRERQRERERERERGWKGWKGGKLEGWRGGGT